MNHDASQPEKLDPVDKMLRIFESADAATVARIDKRIEEVSQQLAQLKRMRSAVAKAAGVETRPRSVKGIDESLEESTVGLVTKNPMTPKEIAGKLGVTHMAIGQLVRRSKRLTKDGRLVTLAG